MLEVDNTWNKAAKLARYNEIVNKIDKLKENWKGQEPFSFIDRAGGKYCWLEFWQTLQET